eukprot:COSAG05_NODE_3442_length_2060_cov_5.664196_1_plen_83_part_10
MICWARYKKKTGKPHLERCPSEFLDILAVKLYTHAYDIDEDVVEHGDYGHAFGIILEGEVHLWRDWARKLKCAPRTVLPFHGI